MQIWRIQAGGIFRPAAGRASTLFRVRGHAAAGAVERSSVVGLASRSWVRWDIETALRQSASSRSQRRTKVNDRWIVDFRFRWSGSGQRGLASDVLARYATELGTPMSQQNALDRFAGKRIGDVTASAEQLVGRPLPGFADELQRRTLKAFETSLREVRGVEAFLQHQHLPRCLASSSTPKRIEFCLSLLKLGSYFGDNIFSADQVARGKPYPDIFLLAADRMDADRTTAVVIEDSPGGVQAALAAGMRVIGLLTATHLRHDHREKLRAAGTELVAADYNEVSKILATL